MGTILDKATGFPIADPDAPIFTSTQVAGDELAAALSTMILSASGWRKVFSSGGEESMSPAIGPADTLIIAAAGMTCAELFLSESKTPTIAVGMDSRPTGPVIADILVRALLSRNCTVQYLFITAAPEIMAHVSQDPEVDGFIYVSASHNPIGHNGLKIGMGDGAVAGGSISAGLIHRFNEIYSTLANYELQRELSQTVDSVPASRLSDTYIQSGFWKEKALRAYTEFSYTVLMDSRDDGETGKLTNMLIPADSNRTGIVAELNGSARTLSIDKPYLQSIGAVVRAVNDEPRQIAHRIVPEGESLEQCRSTLEEVYREDSRFVLGYVPDNDGDRGNIVYIDETSGKAEMLHAQQVFALVVMAELAFAVYMGKSLDNWVVVVNGPTSMIVDRICHHFGVEVVRCEVGEANVVTTARGLRKQGKTVRVMGEGSNGGNITYPAEVRDPLNTLGSLLKLLNIRSENGPFALWCNKSGHTTHASCGYGMGTIVSTLPRYTTTSAYEERALMSINSTDHGILKARYEAIFLSEWEKRQSHLHSLAGIESYRAINYEGVEARIGIGRSFRSGAQKGGLKIEFLDSSESVTAFIWMRGSGTEPVFRILADVEGDSQHIEEYLLSWQRSMIEMADKASLK